MSQVKNEIKTIKERIYSLLILSILFGMLFTSLNVATASNQDTTNLAVNITTGSLDTAAENTDFDWPDATAGQASNQQENMNNIQVTDYRGNSGGWSLTATANNLEAGTNILNTYARAKTSPGDVTNLNSSDNTGVTAGSDNQALGSNATNAVNMMTASAGNGAGAFQLDNTVMNLSIEAGDAAGDYTAVLTLTVS
ncbi:WxL domain-containing protein [Patescibacteria group bacterium]|nr:WxL domain-containing protein [Patescibacteria group bacterium]